jgi:hypothetical protein
MPLIEKASLGRPVPDEIANHRLELGTIRFRGTDLVMPKASIYAVASQIASVPEFRDKAANGMIHKLSMALEKEWKALVDV